MEYQELIKTLEKQKDLHENDSIAKEYLGEELVGQIKDLLKLAKVNDCLVFTHGTFGSNADSIINEGFHFEHNQSDNLELQEKYFKDIVSPDDVINHSEATTFYGSPALKEKIEQPKVSTKKGSKKSLLEQVAESYSEINDLVNKFCNNLGGNYNSLVVRKVPQYGGTPFTSIVFAVIPKNINKITKEYCYVTAETNDFWGDSDEKYLNYYKSSDIDKECFIGYLDVPNKKFIVNESFNMNHLLDGDKQKTNHSFDGIFNK